MYSKKSISNSNFNVIQNNLTFVDLFAGLGGFHLALKKLGHNCVFACELDKKLGELYKKNFGILPKGDIRNISIADDIPKHDILCAGFPCQPFSKAGEQNGFDDPNSGDLFYHIIKILNLHKPQYIILENVANFERHNNGETWSEAKKQLEFLGYEVQLKKLSPHYFGIPQIRERVIIIGSRSGLDHFTWPDKIIDNTMSVKKVLDVNPLNARLLSDQVVNCLNVWQDFLDGFPKEIELPSFPIWSMEFGANYPYEDKAPYHLKIEDLQGYLGSHGQPLLVESKDEMLSLLPSYARTTDEKFPKWKIQFIRQNREFYQKNREWLDTWIPSILPFAQSFQKFEWNCKGENRQLKEFILQLRASGVRVKRPTTSPSLVAMTSTQVPIIAWEQRYMTPRECARLQSMEELKHLPDTPTHAYKALGNAVNVKVVEIVASSLLSISSIHKAILVNA